MSFGNAVSTCFGKYVDFSGRASLAEYWWFVLFLFLMNLVLSVLTWVLIAAEGSFFWIIWLLWAGFVIGTFLPGISVLIRRLHDTGRSGFWWFIGLIPVIGYVVLLFFLVSPSEPRPNAYGEPPA